MKVIKVYLPIAIAKYLLVFLIYAIELDFHTLATSIPASSSASVASVASSAMLLLLLLLLVLLLLLLLNNCNGKMCF
jgi:hypothetical protein